jgi:general secretion pathway protein B
MSYILDALRKSEQQRQAVQPASVTERLLVNQPLPKQQSSKWIPALVIGNLIVAAYFVWIFTQKTGAEPQLNALGRAENQHSPLPVTPQNSVSQKSNQPLPGQTKAKQPSIAEWVETQKMTELQKPKPIPDKDIPEKKPPVVKKNLHTRNATEPALQPETSEMAMEKPVRSPAKKGISGLGELPYETRNTLPDLTINVFSYAQQPEDRFVIIDMVKYRTGQLINGLIKLKEIRPDSIIVQYGDDTFKIERP